MALHDISSTPQTHWEIDPEDVTMKFSIGKSPLQRVSGRFHGVRGWVVTSGDRAADALAQIEIDARSIDTRLKMRDRHLRTGQFLDVKRFPRISFTSTRVEERGEDRFRITGDLTIRGITRQIGLDATAKRRDSDSARITASTILDRRHFKIGPKAMGLVVGNDVQIQIALTLRAYSTPV